MQNTDDIILDLVMVRQAAVGRAQARQPGDEERVACLADVRDADDLRELNSREPSYIPVFHFLPFVYGRGTGGDQFDVSGSRVAANLRRYAKNAELEGVKALAQAHDVVLIFDEVSCGWRLRIGGVQEYLGVTPDMTVVAKGMSNGYPMGAVLGSRRTMELAGRMFISSSYWSDGMGLAATLTTIRELRRRDSERRFEEIGESLRSAIIDSGLSGSVTGVHTNPSITLDLPDPSTDPK